MTMFTYGQYEEILVLRGAHGHSGRVSAEDKEKIEEMRRDLNAYKEKGAIFLSEIEALKFKLGEKVSVSVEYADKGRNKWTRPRRGVILGDYPQIVLVGFGSGERATRSSFQKVDILRGAVKITKRNEIVIVAGKEMG